MGYAGRTSENKGKNRRQAPFAKSGQGKGEVPVTHEVASNLGSCCRGKSADSDCSGVLFTEQQFCCMQSGPSSGKLIPADKMNKSLSS
jgi:hypothetical protein